MTSLDDASIRSSFSFHYTERDGYRDSIKFQSVRSSRANLRKEKEPIRPNLARGTYQPTGAPSPSPWNSFHAD
jgi:hypothetical protein